MKGASEANAAFHLSDRWENIVTSTGEAKHAVQNRPLAAGGILQGAGAAAGVIGTFKEEYVYLRKSYGRSLFVQ